MPATIQKRELCLQSKREVRGDFAAERTMHHVRSRLRRSLYPQLRRVQCEFHDGVLTLRGVVNSYFIRQLAYAHVANVDGVEAVIDRLDVRENLPRSIKGYKPHAAQSSGITN
jgi:osmotically-inducible protein OsmY